MSEATNNGSVPKPAAAATAAAAKPVAAKPALTPAQKQQQLQQQIQQQLQQQLQAQLQAAALKGNGGTAANITPQQIQAQAQAMVQAAAQAQAVVAAGKAKGDNMTPMTAQQIAALSQVQAQAIVNARPKTQDTENNGLVTPAQIQAQVQLQAQALVHAHTQAQIQAGIYKGNGDTASNQNDVKMMASGNHASNINRPNLKRNAAEASLQEKHKKARTEMQMAHKVKLAQVENEFRKQKESSGGMNIAEIERLQKEKLDQFRREQEALVQRQDQLFKQELTQLHESLKQQQKQNVARPSNRINSSGLPSFFGDDSEEAGELDPAAFASHMNGLLTKFWSQQQAEMEKLPIGSEQDFKTHNDLPLARIKRIMKSDEDVRMISAEAPVLFAKACEMFILELTLRSWCYSEQSKRRTLQKEDIQTAVRKTDIFDFLVDIINP